MKKIIILTGALCLLGSTLADAQISVTFGEPAYVAPPVYAPGYAEYYHRYPSQYYDRHGHQRRDDWSYWAHERGQRDERDHHDNGNHGEGNRGNGNRDYR